MKKLVLSVLVLGSALGATPALAQATGSVDVTGSVAARCLAVSPISGNITLGELAKTDGTVDPSFAGNTGGLTRNFTVKCNGSNPKISVDAKPLINAAATNVPAGYTATLVATGAKGGTTPVADQSLTAGATSAQVGDRLAATSNNITLTIGSGLTADPAAILDAGTYAGKVEVTIAPTA